MALNLGKQYGPLPLGGWIAVIVGGLGIGFFINRSQGGSSADDGTEEPIGEESGAGGGQFIYDPPTGVPSPDTGNAITDNLTWAKRAKDYLSALPGVDNVQAANAIERYLSGMSLSVAERALVNLAIAQFGNPPEGVTPVDDKPPVVKPPTDGTNTPKPKPVPKAVYAMTWSQKPTTVRRGMPASFAGKITKNGKGVGTPLLIERRKPGSTTWAPHSADYSNTSNGNWGFQTSFGSTGNWAIRIRHPTSGKVLTAAIKVT